MYVYIDVQVSSTIFLLKDWLDEQFSNLNQRINVIAESQQQLTTEEGKI